MTSLNVLWILCDELRTDALGCYGGAPIPIHTPQIDRLAERGVLFERAFSSSPVCVPARVVMHTGRRPEETGVYGNEAYAPGYPMPEVTTFPEAVADAGWATADFGKEHVPLSMTPWQWQDPTGSHMLEVLAAAPDLASLDLVRTPAGGVVAGRFPADVPYPPSAVVDRVLSWVDSQAGPWLARASFLQPHTPVIPPEPWASRYQDAAWPDAITLDPGVSAFERRFGELTGGAGLTPAELVRAQAAYHGTVAWIDHEVGRLLAGLQALGQADRLAIVFTSDHGHLLGEQGGVGKHTHAPASQQVPLVVVHPDLGPSRRGDLVEQLDLARTMCGLVGVAPPATAGGRDLFDRPPVGPVLSTIGYGEAESTALPNLGIGRWHGDRGWPRRSCVRVGRWRYDRSVRIDGEPIPADHPDADPFLADTLQDPCEVVNLAADPGLASVVRELESIVGGLARTAVETPADVVYATAQPGAHAG